MMLHEFLLEQDRQTLLATVEAVESDASKCKLTPWVENAGCQCSAALVIPKAFIKSVRKTENKHHCCGKTLTVVEVTFSKGASLPLSEVFSQVSQSASKSHHSERVLHQPVYAPSVYPIRMTEESFAPVACPPGLVQMGCAGRFWCVKPGSVCCGNSPCEPPYNSCLFCPPGQWTCVQPGHGCRG